WRWNSGTPKASSACCSSLLAAGWLMFRPVAARPRLRSVSSRLSNASWRVRKRRIKGVYPGGVGMMELYIKLYVMLPLFYWIGMGASFKLLECRLGSIDGQAGRGLALYCKIGRAHV